MKSYKINRKNLKHLTLAPVSITISILSFYAIHWLAGGIFFSLFCIPHAIIHWNYFKLSRNIDFRYNYQTLTLAIGHGSQTIMIPLFEVEKVERFVSPPHYDNRRFYFPWDGYNYSIIYFQGKRIIITSFIADFNKIPIAYDVPCETKRTFYAYCCEKSDLFT